MSIRRDSVGKPSGVLLASKGPCGLWSCWEGRVGALNWGRHPNLPMSRKQIALIVATSHNQNLGRRRQSINRCGRPLDRFCVDHFDTDWVSEPGANSEFRGLKRVSLGGGSMAFDFYQPMAKVSGIHVFSPRVASVNQRKFVGNGQSY